MAISLELATAKYLEGQMSLEEYVKIVHPDSNWAIGIRKLLMGLEKQPVGLEVVTLKYMNGDMPLEEYVKIVHPERYNK